MYKKIAAGLAAGAMLTFALTPAANAEDERQSEDLTLLMSVAPDDIADRVSAVQTELDDGTIAVDVEGSSIALEAPAVDNSTSISKIGMEDGSALFAINLKDPSAATSYDFDVALPAGVSAQTQDDGAVYFIDDEGNFVAGVAAPWAKDSAGNEVPTSFTYANGVLTQLVDTSAVSASNFPVVADPWLGAMLLESAWITYQSSPNTYVVNAVPSAWGRANNAPTTYWAHIEELKDKLGSNKNKLTLSIENQFICHVMGNWFGGGATYNMESWKPNKSMPEWIATGCN